MNLESRQLSMEELCRRALEPDGPVALRLKQVLEPVEESRIIFPPTYADIGYSIDTLSDGTRVATIDSVGSQANRLEPVFRTDSLDPKTWLVPQIQILIREETCGQCEHCRQNEAEGKKTRRTGNCSQPIRITRSLLDLAHRAADAVVRSSPDLVKIIDRAFRALQRGDAGPMCTIAPTSLVFGVWDSRGETSEKRPRLVRSVIRAWDVEVLHAAAQFNSVWKLLDEEQQEALKKQAKEKKTDLSEKGLADSPAVFRKTTRKDLPQFINGVPNPEARVLGGVLVRGQVVREVTVNLVALRGLRGANETETNAIRSYLLGLCLMAATADMDLYLREGCLLRYADGSDCWYAIPRRGEPEPWSLGTGVGKELAARTAEHFREKWPEAFGERWPNLVYQFDIEEAKKLLDKKPAQEGGPSEA